MLPRLREVTILAISGPESKWCNEERMLCWMWVGTVRDLEAMAQWIMRTIWGSGVGGVE
jgi:hypothetical protein